MRGSDCHVTSEACLIHVVRRDAPIRSGGPVPHIDSPQASSVYIKTSFPFTSDGKYSST